MNPRIQMKLILIETIENLYFWFARFSSVTIFIFYCSLIGGDYKLALYLIVITVVLGIYDIVEDIKNEKNS